MPLPITSYQHSCVQDLAWVIRSAPVISGMHNQSSWLSQTWCETEYQACLPQLLALDKHPEPLISALSQLKTRRLGERFECLIAFWLTISPNFELLIKNYPLRQEKITLGEIDFIIREYASSKIIHLEVAIKFYLGADDLNNMAHWYGPGLGDKLDHKYHRLSTHQTRLSHKYPKLMPYPIDESWCMLKGRMYYPLQEPPQEPPHALPQPPHHTDFFAKNHLSGTWHILDKKPQGESFIMLDKDQWMSELADQEYVNTLPDTLEYPRCFAEIEDQKEKSRLFLLPNDYWEKAKIVIL